jgi:hypothetical protein
MGRSSTHSSNFGGQGARRNESEKGRSPLGAIKRPTRDENHASCHISKASDGNSAGWEKVFLTVARALAAQPAA